MYDELIEIEYSGESLYLDFVDMDIGGVNIRLSKEDAKRIRDYLNTVVI